MGVSLIRCTVLSSTGTGTGCSIYWGVNGENVYSLMESMANIQPDSQNVITDRC
mgnify:CR=1 FL=1